MKSKLNESVTKLLSAFALTTVLLLSHANSATAQSVAYTNATFETLSEQGRIENGIMVVRDGKIEEIGKDVKIPDDARVVDMKQMVIMPGIVDPYFVFQVNPANASRTVVFNGRTFTIPGSAQFSVGSFFRVGEYFDPINFDFRPAKRTGITTANLVSDGRGLSAFAHLTEETNADMLFQNEGHLFAKITNQTTALDVIRKPLEPPKSKTTAKTTTKPSTDKPLTSAEKIKKLWEAVQKGDAPLFVNVNNEAAVAYLLQFIKKQEKVKLILVATGPNLYQSLDEIPKNKNISVVLQPGIDTVPFSRDLMNVSKLLADREVPFSISMSLSQSQMNAMQDDPLFPMAMLVKTGLDRETAMKSITLKPAKLLGIDKTHGSLEKEKHANFLVFDGDPLQTGSRLQQVFLNGNKIHEN